MTAKITISLPDDVAEELRDVGNVSAHVAAALRSYHRVQHVGQFLADAGIHPTPEGIDAARTHLTRLRAARYAPTGTAPRGATIGTRAGTAVGAYLDEVRAHSGQQED